MDEAGPQGTASNPSPEAPMNPSPPWLDKAIRLKDELGLRELAAEVGVTVADLTRAFRDHGVRRRVQPAPSSTTLASHPPDTGVRPGSKDAQIETYGSLLGHVPDSEVARLADVSVRTIASYRARHRIPGYDGPRRRHAGGGPGRESLVEAYDDLLGRVPDRVVAELAGMSLGAVRNFRIKNDIEPAGRISPEEIQRRLNAWRADRMERDGNDPLQSAPGQLPRSVAPSPAAPRVSSIPASETAASAGLRAWRFTTRGQDTPRVVLAPTIDAALEKVARIAGGADHVESVEDVGPVLAEGA